MSIRTENSIAFVAFALIAAGALWIGSFPVRPPDNLADLRTGFRCDNTFQPCSNDGYQRHLAYQEAVKKGWLKPVLN